MANGRELTCFRRSFLNVEDTICKLEQDAYKSVLLAFGAQSENISWIKERLMSDLRKELRVSDEQHRELLKMVADDEVLLQIQYWRRCEEQRHGGITNGLPYSNVHHTDPTSQVWKKLKTTHNPQAILAPPLPPSSRTAPCVISLPLSASRKTLIQRSKKRRKVRGFGMDPNQVNGFTETQLIGRRVKTRWPEDNTFYEAVIVDYKAEDGKHGLVYDLGTEKESWEWIDLKEIAPGDLIWVEYSHTIVGNCLPSESVSIGQNGAASGSKKSHVRSMATTYTTRVREIPSEHTFPFEKLSMHHIRTKAQTGFGKFSEKNGLLSELVPFELLSEEVDKLEQEGDLSRLERTKNAIKEHEEALCKALAEVGDTSDEDESEEGHHPSSPTHSEDQQTAFRSRDDVWEHGGYSNEEGSTGGEKLDGSYGIPKGEHLGASEDDEDQQADGEE